MSVTLTFSVRVPRVVKDAEAVGVVPLAVSNVPSPSRSNSYLAMPLSSVEPAALSATDWPSSAVPGVAASLATGGRWTSSWWEAMRLAPPVSVTRSLIVVVPAVP